MADNNELLNGRYRIDECIGSGGMSAVYHGYDTLLDRDVAIKTLNEDLAKKEALLRNFRREAKSAAKLVHPCIVNVYDVGVFNDVNFIVMEYVGGGTLKQEIERRGRIAPKRAIKLALDIASALSLAHARGLVHCDIKPHNILLDEAGNAKVADFGIASLMATAAISDDDNIMGSAHYMSPEQGTGESVTAQSDLYSLGVVLFEMLTGKLPFEADNPVDVVVRHMNDDVPLLRKFSKDAEPMLESIISKALAKDRLDRYQNAYEMMNDLKYADSMIEDNDDTADEYERMLKEQFSEVTMPISGSTVVRESLNKKVKNWTYRATVSALLLIGFTIGLFAVYGNFWTSAEVTVPDVRGKSREMATQSLRNLNLRVSVEEDFAGNGPLGFVGNQNPEPGAVVKEGRNVKIYINSSKDSVIVPDLLDLTLEQAQIRLRDLGLVVGAVKETFSKNIQDSLVISQNPVARTKINKGSSVDITISRREDGKIVVPSIIGYQVSKGVELLNVKKLRMGKVGETESDAQPGTIVYQYPRPGAEVDANTTIEMVVAKPKNVVAPIGDSVELNFVVPTGKDPQQIKIVSTRGNAKVVLYDAKHNSGEKIRLTVYTGAKVEFFVDGALTGVRNL